MTRSQHQAPKHVVDDIAFLIYLPTRDNMSAQLSTTELLGYGYLQLSIFMFPN